MSRDSKVKGWLLAGLGLILMLGGALAAHLVQTAGGVTVSAIRIATGEGRALSAHLYRPQGATPQTPAPGVLAVHGYINSRETQSPFAIELARRGYVVLALDQSGHGYSDPPAFAEGFGGPAALAHLRSLDFVDRDRIGLEGHSMGGWTVLAAASAAPEDYRAVALVGSSTGPPFAAPGTTDWPRNTAVVFSKYDEFARLMWGVDRAADVGRSEKLRTLFGAGEPVAAGRDYGSVDLGTARRLTIPVATHPGDHLSTGAVGDVLDWFDTVIGAPSPRPRSDQIWWVKELSTGAGLIGAVLFLMGAFAGLLSLPAFAAARAEGRGGAGRTGAGWVAALLATAAVPAIAYYPLTAIGGLFPETPLTPQAVTNQVFTWSLAPALLALVSVLVFRRRGGEGGLAAKLVLALAPVGLLYAATAAAGLAFNTDFRFWVVALKPLAGHHLLAFLTASLWFAAFFYLTQRALHATLTPASGGALVHYAVALIATVGGFALMTAGVYAWLFIDGRLPGVDPLFSVVAIQFVPVLAATALLSVFTWRRTDGAFSGAVMCGALIGWYITAGQATHLS